MAMEALRESVTLTQHSPIALVPELYSPRLDLSELRANVLNLMDPLTDPKQLIEEF